jgi:hypothetical protein
MASTLLQRSRRRAVAARRDGKAVARLRLLTEGKG